MFSSTQNLKIHIALGSTDMRKYIDGLSIAAWQHINLNGRYEFTKSQDVVNMQKIILELIKSSNKEEN
nr:hypothetical protein [uncultured Desulfobacter sp.]